MRTNLSANSYWNNLYSGHPEHKKGDSFISKEIDLTYSEYILFKIIFPKYLPTNVGTKLLEIGSAPGEFLIKLNKRFNYIPYGIEYTKNGAKLNQHLFKNNNLPPKNIIYGDFFDTQIKNSYVEYFDIVLSRGLIEHFTDLPAVIDNHLAYLKPGGVLVVTIPNLSGINYYLCKFFNKEILAKHNLKIMHPKAFNELFIRPDLQQKYCGLFGCFSFSLFNTPPEGIKEKILRACRFLQNFINHLFHFLKIFPSGETAFFSPYYIYIGEKK